MSLRSRVIWQEGMFLRAQHFQQQDRWIEHVLRSRFNGLGPFWWGVSELVINREALGIGRFALQSASGVFRDGTPFSFPDSDADDPPPLEPGESVRNTLVYLALPAPPTHAVQVGTAAGVEDARLNAHDHATMDTHSGTSEPADLVIGRLRLRFLLGDADLSGYQCIAVARIREVSSDRRIILDDRWIAPALCCHVAPPLVAFVNDLVGMVNQRGEELASRVIGGGARVPNADSDFLLLQALNRWLNLLRHWAAAAALHPERLYEMLIQMAGELATFADKTRRSRAYPLYRHEDLQSSFAPVMEDLHRSLTRVTAPGVVEIILESGRGGFRRGLVPDRGIFDGSEFFLVVRASMRTEELRRMLPDHLKIGAMTNIRDMVSSAVSGISVQPLPVAPPQLPYIAGATYFELDLSSPYWPPVKTDSAFGLHVSGEFPELKMQLWAVRE